MMPWKIDPAHSSIHFTARHMMVTNVHGEFKTFDGIIDFDDQKPANTKVDITIDAASIDTHEPPRDAHLRSADFLNAEVYPTVTFKSTSVEAVDEQHAKLNGELTIRGITRPVILEVEYFGQGKNPYGATIVGFNSLTRINRKDWDLTWNVALESGGFLVGDQVTINIELELVKQVEAVAEAVAEAAQD